MINWGNVPSGAVLPFTFATYGKTNGESITLTGLAVTDIEVYKGVSMTQRSSDAGYVLTDTDGIDLDGITGIHGFSIDTGDNTDAGFYAVGSYFTVVVSAVTVDGQTINFVAGTFRLMAAEGIAGVPDVNATHVSDTAQTGRDLGASVLISSGSGAGQLDVTSGVIKANLAQILGTALTETAGLLAGGFKKFFNIASPVSTMDVLARVTLADTVTTYTGNTPQTGDSFARIGVAGAGLTNIDLPNQTMDITGNITGNLSGSVGSVTAGVTLAAAAVQAIWDALTSALTTVGSIGKLLVDNVNATISSRATPAQVNTEADTAIADAALATAANLALVKSDTAAILVDTNELQTDWADGGRLDLILDAASAPSAAVVADAVWDELLSGHAGVGSTGAALSAAGGSGDPWATAIPGSYGAGTAGKILGDNVNATISSRSSHSAADVWASGTRTLTSFGTLIADIWASGTRTLTSFGTLAADVWASTTRLLTAGTNIVLAKGVGLTGFNDLSAAEVNAEADTALADYDGPTHAELTTALGANGANLSAIPWNAAWDAEIQSEVQDALDGTLADSIPADGTAPSISQALYMLTQFMLERSVSSTTVTVKKPNGSTTLFTLTLNDATTPTSITRAT